MDDDGRWTAVQTHAAATDHQHAQRRPWQEVFADYAPVILFAAARAFVRAGRPARISQNVAH
jgi:hypothetical protein